MTGVLRGYVSDVKRQPSFLKQFDSIASLETEVKMKKSWWYYVPSMNYMIENRILYIQIHDATALEQWISLNNKH